MVLIVPKNVFIQLLNSDGSVLSTVSTSPENLFIILPEGVVSKKDIGERRTLASMWLCRVPAARTMRMEAMMEYNKIRSAEEDKIDIFL